MTDRAQFEAMLEALINDDQQAAKEIFHNIVVGKSREIYEELLAEDFSQDTGNPYKKNEGMEEEEEESMEEDSEEEESDDAEDDGEENPFGGDDDGEESDDAEDDGEESDDAEDDGEENPFGGEEGEGDIEDRVMDLEDALEDLKAEFEQLLAGEEHEEENEPGVHGDGMPMHDIEADMGGMGGEHDELEGLMEYTIKVPNPKHGDDGVNKKSTIDNMKNDMGGTTANIAQSFSTEKGGTQGGLAKPTTTIMDAGNINKPGGNAGKTAFKKKEPGHGAEKKSTGDNGSNKKSLISSRVR